MSRYSSKTRYNYYFLTGFVLFVLGILSAFLLGTNQIFQVVGVVLIVVSSAMFGASIGVKTSSKP